MLDLFSSLLELRFEEDSLCTMLFHSAVRDTSSEMLTLSMSAVMVMCSMLSPTAKGMLVLPSIRLRLCCKVLENVLSECVSKLIGEKKPKLSMISSSQHWNDNKNTTLKNFTRSYSLLSHVFDDTEIFNSKIKINCTTVLAEQKFRPRLCKLAVFRCYFCYSTLIRKLNTW